MRYRLNLQWKILLLVAGLMTAITLTSFYLHGASVRSLVEQDHYDSAVAQTLSLAALVSGDDYFSDPEGLRQWVHLVAASRPDFRQIDVYERGADGDRLVATNAPDAPRLSTIATRAGGGRSPLPGVSSRGVTVDGGPCWLITAAINGPQHSGAISVLVPRGARPGLVNSLTRAFYLALTVTVAASVLPLYLLFVYFFRRPSRDIVQAMALARGGQLSVRAAVRRDDELGDIARGFNELMDDLGERDREREELMRRISRFNDELAHEIGTPLNVISGHIQLLARGNLDPDTQRRFSIINNQIAFIVQTVRGLLERTHGESLMPAEEAEAAGVEVKADDA